MASDHFELIGKAMKRTIVLLIVFLLLGGATIYFLSNRQDRPNTLSSWDREFAVEDVSEIHKIFLADRKGRQTTLERRDDHWIYQGKYKANPNVVKSLLQAIRLVELQYIPPHAALETMVKDLAVNGVKVELYDQNNELMKAYYVGGTTADGNGTFMIMENSEQPYVMQLPTMVGDLGTRFRFRGEDWRDKTVLGFDPDAIDFVSIEYPKQKSNSFVLERKEAGFEVSPFYEITPRINRPVVQSKAEAYLLGFEEVIAEAFENENPLRDSITQRIPFSIITIKTNNGSEKVITLHPAKDKTASGPDPVFQRYLADIEPEGDFMLVQHNLIKKVFRAYDFFFENK
jgi:hypothetical protein